MRKTILRLLPSIGSWVIAGGLQVSGIEIPWLGYSLMILGIFLLIIPIYPYIRRNSTTKDVVFVRPIVGKRETDWEQTEHLMWAELEVKNNTANEQKDVQVHIVRCLTLQEKQDSESHNDFVIWDHQHLNPFCVYWSKRQTEPKQMSIVIPSNATRSVVVAFQENSNGGQFNFNTTYNNWMVGGFKIDVEISSYQAVLWHGNFYIECHPNYVQGERAKFEFIEWNKWAANRNIVPLNLNIV
jgi:hypothetical protein